MKVFLEGLFNERIRGLHTAMDLTTKRQDALASNIANAETPGYRATDVDFAGELERAFKVQNPQQIAKTDPKHIDVTGFSSSHYIKDLSGVTKPDGNNVDIDIQMGQISRNRAQFQNAAQFMRASLGFLSNVVRQSQ